MLINAVLWLILIGMIVVVPIGCYMTRSRRQGCTAGRTFSGLTRWINGGCALAA